MGRNAWFCNTRTDGQIVPLMKYSVSDVASLIVPKFIDHMRIRRSFFSPFSSIAMKMKRVATMFCFLHLIQVNLSSIIVRSIS